MIVEAGFGILIGVGIASAVFAYHNKDDRIGIDKGLPPVKTKVSMPEVKPSKDAISEPVISFVECVKKNPRRFMVEEVARSYDYSTFTLMDNKTIEMYSVSVYKYRGFVPYGDPEVINFYHYPSFITESEMRFTYDKLISVYNERKERYEELKNQRERRRLTKIYKESV